MGIREDRSKLGVLAREMEEVRQRIKEYENLSPTQKLAETLHTKLCHSSQCDWGYSSWQSMTDITVCRPQYVLLASQLITAGLDPNKFPNL